MKQTAAQLMGCFEPSCHFLDITQHSIGSDSNGQGIEEMIQPSGEKNLSVGGGSIFFVLKQNIMKHIMKYQYSEYKFHFPIVFLKAAGSSSVQCRLPSQSHCECHSTLVYASLPITSHLHSQAAASWELWDTKPSAQQDVDDKSSRAPGGCWAPRICRLLVLLTGWGIWSSHHPPLYTIMIRYDTVIHWESL